MFFVLQIVLHLSYQNNTNNLKLKIMKTKSKVYEVTYTKAIGTIGTILVKAMSAENAINNAKYLCFTGKDFRSAVECDKPYNTPYKNGFQGSQRAN